MNDEQFAQILRVFNRRRPFRPYLIEMNSGDRITVRHPEVVAPRGLVYVFISANSEYRLFVPASVCQVLLPPAQG